MRPKPKSQIHKMMCLGIPRSSQPHWNTSVQTRWHVQNCTSLTFQQGGTKAQISKLPQEWSGENLPNLIKKEEWLWTWMTCAQSKIFEGSCRQAHVYKVKDHRTLDNVSWKSVRIKNFDRNTIWSKFLFTSCTPISADAAQQNWVYQLNWQVDLPP